MYACRYRGLQDITKSQLLRIVCDALIQNYVRIGVDYSSILAQDAFDDVRRLESIYVVEYVHEMIRRRCSLDDFRKQWQDNSSATDVGDNMQVLLDNRGFDEFASARFNHLDR